MLQEVVPGFKSNAAWRLWLTQCHPCRPGRLKPLPYDYKWTGLQSWWIFSLLLPWCLYPTYSYRRECYGYCWKESVEAGNLPIGFSANQSLVPSSTVICKEHIRVHKSTCYNKLLCYLWQGTGKSWALHIPILLRISLCWTYLPSRPNQIWCWDSRNSREQRRATKIIRLSWR